MIIHKSYLRSIFLCLTAVLILPACSSPPEPVEEAAPVEKTEASAEPNPTPQPTVEIIPLEDLEEWDLVWVTDSSGWGVAQVYADMIAEDTGKVINLRDLWDGGLPAGRVLDAL